MLRYVIFSLFACLVFQGASQNSSLEPYTYLEDDRSFSFQGNEFRLNRLEVSRKFEIQINTEEGAQIFKKFTLPEKIDPLQEVKAANSNMPIFYVFIDKINEIEIIIKRDGQILRPAQEKPEYLKTKILSKALDSRLQDKQLYRNVIFYVYTLPTLKKDDIIEIRYTYTAEIEAWHNLYMKYSDNLNDTISTETPSTNDFALNSFRLFFHDQVSKKHSKLRIETPIDAPISFRYKNDGIPHTSRTLDRIIDKWEFDDLPGALSEKGSYPYEELPHVEIRLIKKALQYYPEVSRQISFSGDFLSIKVGSTFKEFQILKNYITKFKENATDTSLLVQMRDLHNDLALNFTYDDDQAQFNNENLFEQKFGENLEAGTVHESTKYQLHRNLIHSMGFYYAYGFIEDKRLGIMSNHYCFPKFRNDYLFLPVYKKMTIFLMPKSSPHGYLADELPFYYEDTKLQSTYKWVDNSVDRNLSVTSTRYSDTPSSNQNDNQRIVYGKIEVNEQKADFTFQITLNGQFSTLQRNLYMHDEKHPYVDSWYHTKWWEKNAISDLNFKSNLLNEAFPFTTKITGELTSELSSNKIMIGQWIDHHTVEVDTPRVLSFHPDFLCEDRIILMINLGNKSPMEIPESFSISNDFAHYQLSFEKTGDHSIKFTSWLTINQKTVKPENISQVKEIYDAVLKAKNAEIALN